MSCKKLGLLFQGQGHIEVQILKKFLGRVLHMQKWKALSALNPGLSVVSFLNPGVFIGLFCSHVSLVCQCVLVDLFPVQASAVGNLGTQI